MRRFRQVLVVLVMALMSMVAIAAPASAQSQGGSLTCPATQQAKIQVYGAGIITVAINGNYYQTGYSGAPYYFRYLPSGSYRMNFFIYSAGPMAFTEYCGTW